MSRDQPKRGGGALVQPGRNSVMKTLDLHGDVLPWMPSARARVEKKIWFQALRYLVGLVVVWYFTDTAAATSTSNRGFIWLEKRKYTRHGSFLRSCMVRSYASSTRRGKWAGKRKQYNDPLNDFQCNISRPWLSSYYLIACFKLLRLLGGVVRLFFV